MNNDLKCRTLLEKLDIEISRLQSFSPEKVPGLTENPRSVRFNITKDTNVDDIPDDKILLAHSLLHMFYHNKNGANLSLKSIEQLHEDVSKRMENHSKFDKLDN